MSFTSAGFHCITELAYVSADDRTNLVTFRSMSASRGGEWNYTTINAISGATTCGCQGANAGGGCWHRTLAQAAFDALPARVQAARLTVPQLLQAGTKAANMVRVYRRRVWRVLPADQLMLVVTRAEWRERQSVSATPARAERAERAALVALTTPTGKLLGCPDCGTPTRNPYLCTDCVNDTMAARVRQQRVGAA